MEYRRFENTVIVRMDRNEDLFAELKKVALKENIKLASISALGTFSHMNVGVYDLDQRKFVGNDFDGMFEIVSLTGTINTMDGEYYCHLHTAAGDKNGNVRRPFKRRNRGSHPGNGHHSHRWDRGPGQGSGYGVKHL